MTFEEKFNKAKELSYGRNERLGKLLDSLRKWARDAQNKPKLRSQRETVLSQIRRVQAELRKE